MYNCICIASNADCYIFRHLPISIACSAVFKRIQNRHRNWICFRHFYGSHQLDKRAGRCNQSDKCILAMAKFYGAVQWDPKMIVLQMICLQVSAVRSKECYIINNSLFKTSALSIFPKAFYCFFVMAFHWLLTISLRITLKICPMLRELRIHSRWSLRVASSSDSSCLDVWFHTYFCVVRSHSVFL